tara:strand:- start:1240 stop:1980 length:741 start_codon:yes stop_codon:yes gene_type:complete
MTNAPYTVFQTSDELFFFLASEFERYSHCAEIQHISLSGGSTPKGLFTYIVNSNFKVSIKWSNLHFWWGDERCVGFSDAQSNYGEAKRLLFDHINIPINNLHAMPVDECDTTKAYENASMVYSNEMIKNLAMNGQFPKFDWVLLGVGDDGHTASLFPNVTDLNTERFALLVLKPNTNEYRISLSAKTIRAAKRISYLVTGNSKAKVISDIILEKGDFNTYPAYLVRTESGCTEYLLDQQASSLLAS